MPAKSRSGQLRAQRRANGLCVTCGSPVEPDATGYRKARCADCQAVENGRAAQRRKDGLCVKCGKPALVVKDGTGKVTIRVQSRCADCR